jgi:hypothetical protein
VNFIRLFEKELLKDPRNTVFALSSDRQSGIKFGNMKGTPCERSWEISHR